MSVRALLIVVLSFALAPSASAALADTCHGAFPNLFSDICWDCAMPIKLFGGVTINAGQQEDYDSGGIPNLCQCSVPGNPIPKSGFHTSFWEFARQIDVTRTPYCFVSLGFSMDMGINSNEAGARTTMSVDKQNQNTWFRHAHWYINPVMGLMQIILDSKCLEPKGFDIGYMSEIDPTHVDEEMERILNPDSYLFGNIVAQLACSADCVAATVSWPLNTLYWCAGCNGTVFPMTGFLPSSYDGVQASSLLTQKVTAKMHRMLTQWSASGPGGMCGYFPEINMDKRQYKYSMIYPSAQSSGDTGSYPNGGQALNLATTNSAASNAYAQQAQQAQSSQFMRCCQPYGRTTVIWGAGREIPVTGEDFAYAIFRKRDCCQ